MVFRYWRESSKIVLIKNIDSIIFDSPEKLSFRREVSGRFEWTSVKFGVDYLHFTITKE